MKYGFTLAVVEGRKTIPTLWDTTRDFMARHADLVAAPNLLDFVIGPDGGVPLHLSALGITDGRPPLIQSNILASYPICACPRTWSRPPWSRGQRCLTHWELCQLHCLRSPLGMTFCRSSSCSQLPGGH